MAASGALLLVPWRQQREYISKDAGCEAYLGLTAYACSDEGARVLVEQTRRKE